MNKRQRISLSILFSSFILLGLFSCKTKKHITQTEPIKIEDTLGRCHLLFKTAKSLSKHIKENELNFTWLTAKANTEIFIDGESHSLDVRVKAKRDSAIWISIQAAGLLDIAKLLITKDSVKMIVYIKRQYFHGDFNYINQLLNADLDFEIIQASLFGNSANFDDDDAKMKPIVDRENCQYLLSTVRRRKLRRITSGQDSLKKSLQTMRLNPENFKIITNEFQDIETNRSFYAKYDRFLEPDSVFAPHYVNIEIKAEKKIDLKINYVRIDINQPQKLSLTIPKNYESILIKKEKP